MPVYNFTCSLGHKTKRLMTLEAFKESMGTTHCSHEYCSSIGVHDRGAATSQAMEVLDDGIRPVRLERYSEAERLFKEREEAHRLKYEQTDQQEE